MRHVESAALKLSCAMLFQTTSVCAVVSKCFYFTTTQSHDYSISQGTASIRYVFDKPLICVTIAFAFELLEPAGNMRQPSFAWSYPTLANAGLHGTFPIGCLELPMRTS